MDASAGNFWERGSDLQMVLCQSVSAGGAVSTLITVGDTQTLTAIIKFI